MTEITKKDSYPGTELTTLHIGVQLAYKSSATLHETESNGTRYLQKLSRLLPNKSEVYDNEDHYLVHAGWIQSHNRCMGKAFKNGTQ